MVAESYRPSEKSKVQGFHDLVLFGSVALASFLLRCVSAWNKDSNPGCQLRAD
jgi:hypothetical protein